jgi:hypothetical protein
MVCHELRENLLHKFLLILEFEAAALVALLLARSRRVKLLWMIRSRFGGKEIFLLVDDGTGCSICVIGLQGTFCHRQSLGISIQAWGLVRVRIKPTMVNDDGVDDVAIVDRCCYFNQWIKQVKTFCWWTMALAAPSESSACNKLI